MIHRRFLIRCCLLRGSIKKETGRVKDKNAGKVVGRGVSIEGNDVTW